MLVEGIAPVPIETKALTTSSNDLRFFVDDFRNPVKTAEECRYLASEVDENVMFRLHSRLIMANNDRS